LYANDKLTVEGIKALIDHKLFRHADSIAYNEQCKRFEETVEKVKKKNL